MLALFHLLWGDAFQKRTKDQRQLLSIQLFPPIPAAVPKNTLFFCEANLLQPLVNIFILNQGKGAQSQETFRVGFYRGHRTASSDHRSISSK